MKPVADHVCFIQQAPRAWLLYENGHAVLTYPSGERRRLHQAEHLEGAFSPDWSVDSIHLQLAPTVIIFLKHVSGSAQRWIVGASDKAYDAAIPQLPAPVRDALYLSTMRLLCDLHDFDGTSLAAWNALPRLTRLELLANLASYPGASGRGLFELFCTLKPAFFPTLSVLSDDGIVSVLLPNGMEIPILFGGSVLRTADLQPGWTADALYCDFAPFHLLMLHHEGGDGAVWVLDRNLLWVGDRNNLPHLVKEELRSRAAPILRRYLDSVLAFADPGSDPVIKRWLGIDPGTRDTLCVLCTGAIYPEPTSLSVQQMPSALPIVVSGGNRQTTLLRHDAVEKAVTTDLHEQIIKAVKSGRLEWPSPVDGSVAMLHGVIMWDDCTFFYQFTDQNGLDFIIIASDRCARMVGLFLPGSNLILFDHSLIKVFEPNVWLQNNLGGNVWELLIRHVNRYTQEMTPRRLLEQPRLVNVLLAHPRVHIGHHLWNDLSGFEALCHAVPPEHLPTTLIIGASDGSAELFGPIESLFPATLGRIDRSVDTIDAFIRWVYLNDVWPARITREYVSASLRRRVAGHLAKADEVTHTQATLMECRKHKDRAPIIIFGLRVEDRTLVDLSVFCQAFVGFMAERHPGSTIVFDGYNCRPGAASGSVNPGMVYYLARQPPEKIEADLVASLIEHFDGKPITIVGTTGQSIATSLVWCLNADAAFAVWGAGLAKIRWLANLPTMIVTSRTNMLSRNDLSIYYDPAFMEEPAPVLLPNSSLVTDAPEHVALATGFIQGGRECFTVDADRILSEFEAFLDRVI